MREQQRLIGFALAGLILMADQLSKTWAVAQLPLAVRRPLLPGLLDLQLVYNRGAAFSMLTGATTLLALVSAAVAIVVALWLWRLQVRGHLQLFAAAALLGGCLGNGVDRWRLGAVVDFLALVPIDFPVFNLADVAINLAVISFALSLLRGERHHEG